LNFENQNRIWCYSIWALATFGLLIIEPMLYLIFGAGTVPGTPFKVIKYIRIKTLEINQQNK
jgi:hypothetical protein